MGLCQVCFLSAIDLHTQCAYQLMVPEAIAIVCAPTSNPSVGILTLSAEGIRDVQHCALGGFHPHAQVCLLTFTTFRCHCCVRVC